MTHNGKVHHKKVACCTLNISVLKDKHGFPEDFEIVPIGGGCKCNLAAIKEMLVAMLECDLAERAIDALRGHHCKACALARQKTPKDKEPIYKSCADAISTVLRESIDEYNKSKKEDTKVETK